MFNVEAFFVDGGTFTGINVSWQSGGVEVATGANVVLPEGNYTVSISRPGCASQEIDVVLELTIPILEFTGPEDGDFFCYGVPIDMEIAVTNATVNDIVWTHNSATVSTGNTYNIAEAMPTDAGLYMVNVNYGDGCDTAFMFSILVGDNILVDITPVDAAYCLDDDVTFTAAPQGGGTFPTDQVLSWDGGSGSGEVYTFQAFAPGINTVVLDITDGDGCLFSFDHNYLVHPLPQVELDVSSRNICNGETATLTAVPTEGTPPFTYLWGPDELFTGDTYLVEPPYTDNFTDLFVVITDANGCSNFSFFETITINNTPPRPTLTCDPICVSEIEFSWNSPGADFFHLFLSINGGAETLVSDDYTGTTYVATGLNPGDNAELRVVPFAGDAVNSCEGSDRSQRCTTPLTSTPGFIVDFPAVVCADGASTTFDLSVAAGEAGTFVFNSTSLGLSNTAADPSGVSTITVPALSGGNNTELHQIEIQYVGIGGRCPADTTIELTATRPPVADFSFDATSRCDFIGSFIASLNNPPTPGAIYDLTLEDPIVGSVTANGDGTFAVTIDSFGTHSLVMVTQNALNAMCADTFRTNLTLTEPLPAPSIQCGAVGLDFVTFIWNDTGHDDYIVNEILIPAGGTLTRNGNSVTVSNLNVNDIVTVSVTGTSAGCPDVTSAEQTCVAESCPDVTIAIDAVGPFCADENMNVDFDISGTGIDGTGTLIWEIDGAGFSGTFNPSVLGAGTYTIDALLDQGCDFRASFQLEIGEVPSSLFDLPNGPVCTDTPVLGAAAGAEMVGWSYVWEAPGADVSPGTDEASRNFSWPAPGRYFVSLTVTNDENCTGETHTDSIDVIAPLAIPVVSCDTVTIESVTFAWTTQPEIDSFLISVDGGPTFTQDSTTLMVTGLAVNQTVSIEVIPLADTPCPATPAGTASCTTVPCPALQLTPPADLDICEGEVDPLTPLIATVIGSAQPGGTFTFTGTGVTMVGPDFFFDASVAGIGPHLLTVDFDDGICMAQETFTFTVIERPTAEFTINGLMTGIELCVGEPFTLAYTGNMTAGDSADFCYVFLEQTPEPIDTIGFETYTCRYNQPGPFRICLVVKNEGCPSDTLYGDGFCFAPLPPPIVRCESATLNSVTFAWDDVGSLEGYTVVRSNGDSEVTFDNMITYNGLEPGEIVTIEVIVNDSGPCGPGETSGFFSCSARPCPNLVADVTSIPEQICILDGTESIDLNTVRVSGGTGTGTYTFSGTGVSGTTFNAAAVPSDEAGTSYTISIEYIEDGPCSLTFTADVTVFARPTAFLTDPGDQCLGETMIITVGSTNFVANADITVDFDGGTVVPDGNPDDATYSVFYTTPGTKNITATVTSNISGCPSEETTLQIEVSEPLPALNVTCANPDLESVTFTWDPVPGATGYEGIDESGIPFTLGAGATELSVVNLEPGQSYSITVFATGDGPCGNGPAVTATCMTDLCPPGVIQSTTLAQDICLDGNESSFRLNAELTEGDINGTITWSGRGVIDSVMSSFFDPTGLPPGQYPLTVNYDGPANCDSEDQVTITLFEAPVIAFSAIPAQLCEGEEFNVSFTGSVPDGATLSWNFGDAAVTDLGNENYLLRWDTPGGKTITLDIDGNCPVSGEFSIPVIPALSAPAPTCTRQDLDGVLFEWPAVAEATVGYRISINGGPFSGPQTETSFLVSGLDFGENVSISVISVRSGTTCDESMPSSAVDCAARVCPEVTLAPAAAQTEFCADETNIVLLEANLNGDDGTGTTVWSGPGVVANGDDFIFDPSLVGLGTHRLYVTYVQETLCSYTDSLEMDVFALPIISSNIIPAQLCQGEEFNIFFTGTAAEGAIFNWDFDGAAVTDLGDENYLLRWDTPGDKTVTLTVTDNCATTASFSIPVTPTLDAPVPACVRQDLDGVLFEWPAVAEATVGYRISINGGPFSDPQTETSFLVSGLDFGENVSISVISVRSGTTCDESMPSSAVDCSARICPAITLAPAAAQTEFCADETNTVLLEANLSGDDGTGTTVWSGPGVVANGDDFTFDPSLVGLGSHRLYVTYVQEALCSYTDSLEMEVFALPVVTFNTIPTQLCQGEEFNVFFTGSAAGGATFNWDFDGAVVTELGDESYLLRWDTPGGKTVTLTVADNCTSTASFSIPIVPTLDAPVPACVRQDLDGVLFEWPAVAEATVGYRISINGGPFSAPQTETSFLVSDLDFGENVSISVISVRSGTTCDESVPSPAVDCAARVCPDVTMAPAAAQTTFCDTELNPVLLNANLNGDDGTGILEWTGDGVSFDNGNWIFDPVAAGVGPHTLNVTYSQETLCSYNGAMEMMINATPSLVLGSSTDLTCTATDVTVGIQGADPGTTYTWDYAGASVTDRGNESFDLSWSAAGTYTVSVTANSNGCTNTASTMVTVEGTVEAGTPVAGALELCVSTTDPIDLSQRVTGAMPGGTWSVVSGGVPSGSLDAATGILTPGGLAVGDYTFAYTVAGGTCPDDNAEVALRLLGAPVANAGEDQRLTCNMGMVSLNGSNSETGEGYTYLWTSDNPTNFIMDADRMMADVSQPGTYTLRVTNAIGCTATSEVEVTAETEAPVMEIELSQITCFASDNGAISVTNVSGGRPPYTFSLNGEERGASTLFAGLEPAEYDLQITDANGCFSNIIVDITEPNELTVSLRFPGDSTTANAGDNVFISATINGGNPIDTLIWEPDSLVNTDGQNGINFIADETRMISVTVVDELGCSASDQMMLLVRRNRPVYFPTAFSPNGDNINDIFFIGGDLDQIDFIDNFFIFDRWGEALYSGDQINVGGNPVGGPGNPSADVPGFLPNDPDFGWDGRLNGKLLNPQVLVYTATVHFRDGEVIVYKGDFVLMR